MASELQLTTIRGVPTGANANEIVIPAGQKIVAADSAAITSPGMVLQVIEEHLNTYVTISTTGAKVFGNSITTKAANSKILVQLVTAVSNNNLDQDRALAMGYKTGAATSSSSDYTSLHGSIYNRAEISNLGSFFATDTADPGGGTWNGRYGLTTIQFNKLHSPNVAAGTVLDYSLWGGVDTDNMKVGTSYNPGSPGSANTGNGYDTSLLLWEIAQ